MRTVPSVKVTTDVTLCLTRTVPQGVWGAEPAQWTR